MRLNIEIDSGKFSSKYAINSWQKEKIGDKMKALRCDSSECKQSLHEMCVALASRSISSLQILSSYLIHLPIARGCAKWEHTTVHTFWDGRKKKSVGRKLDWQQFGFEKQAPSVSNWYEKALERFYAHYHHHHPFRPNTHNLAHAEYIRTPHQLFVCKHVQLFQTILRHAHICIVKAECSNWYWWWWH